MSEDIFDRMQRHFEEMKDCSYREMIELAELDVDETACLHDECKAMDYAMLKVLKHGAGRDVVEAMRHYISYMIGSRLISLPR